MSTLLAEECRKCAAKRAEKAEQQDDPERRREYLYLATIWRVIARESEDAKDLRSQARSRSLMKIRRAQHTSALSIVLHLTQRAELFSHEKNNLKSVILGRGMSVGGLNS